MTKVQDAIARKYSQITRQLGKYASRSHLIKNGVSRDDVRAHFGDMDGLKEKAREAYPEYYSEIIDPDRFNTDIFNDLKDKVAKYKRFVVTSAVAGQDLDDDFLASIKTYCKARKALLLILPADYQLFDLDKDLVDENIVFRDLKLNNNISLSTVKIHPKQVDPITGLDRFGQTGRGGKSEHMSYVFASPKQRLKPVANSSSKMPHVLMTPGAITKPKYMPRGGSQRRRDYIATHDHIMGAIIIEIQDKQIYHFRQIQADKDGSFIDLGVEYSEDGHRKVKAAAVVYGDYHSGETDPNADKAGEELCALVKPKYLVLHDFFNGKSISHHERHKQITQAVKAGKGQISLATEVFALKRDLEKLVKRADKTLIVKSNHDEFLERHLEDGDFDDQNRVYCMQLAIHMAKGLDPLKAAVEDLGFKSGDQVIWLDRDQDFIIAGIQVGAHGDLGANGSRSPGAQGMEKAYGNVTFGHCHFSECLRGAWSVGTSTYLKLNYNRGPSSWMQTHQVIYENGSRQNINVIGTSWCMVE